MYIACLECNGVIINANSIDNSTFALYAHSEQCILIGFSFVVQRLLLHAYGRKLFMIILICSHFLHLLVPIGGVLSVQWQYSTFVGLVSQKSTVSEELMCFCYTNL